MKGYDNNDQDYARGARLWYGIFMVLVYIGVGLLFIFGVFNITSPVINYCIGGLLCAYGVWRAVRLYLGYR